MNKYLIIPNCSDLNRGDQALVWEAQRFAIEAFGEGECFLTADDNEPLEQTQRHGIRTISLVLQHPSRVYRRNDSNLSYGALVKLKWGAVAALDFISSAFLLNRYLFPLGKALLSGKQREALQAFVDADYVFVKGGGFIHSTGGLVDWYYIYYSVFHILLAQALHKPVYVLPNSFGPIEGVQCRKLATRALKGCNLVMVRESISREYLDSKCGLKTLLTPDHAFYLERSARDFSCLHSKRSVAITVRPYRFPGAKDSETLLRRYYTAVAGFADHLIEVGFKVCFVEHVRAVRVHESDAKAIQEILALMETPHLASVYSDETLDCKDLKSIYSNFDYIVGTRFHSYIFGVSERVPSMAIAYSGNKAQGITRDMGLENLCVRIDETTTDMLIRTFNYLVENREEVLRKIDAYLDGAKDAWESSIQAVRESSGR